MKKNNVLTIVKTNMRNLVNDLNKESNTNKFDGFEEFAEAIIGNSLIAIMENNHIEVSLDVIEEGGDDPDILFNGERISLN